MTRSFIEAVQTLYAARAAACGARGAKTGALTVVQRTSSNLRLNPHLHAVFLDGAYHGRDGELVWRQLGHLTTSEVGAVLERVFQPSMRAKRALREAR